MSEQLTFTYTIDGDDFTRAGEASGLVKRKLKQLGFSPDVKAYKADPGAFKGHVGDVSTVIRVAITGRKNSPDLCAIMQLLGKERCLERMEQMKKALQD